MRSSSELSLLLDIFNEINPLLLPAVAVVAMGVVACRMVEMSPTIEEAVGGVRRDVIWGGRPDHADTTLLLLEVVVVMIGEAVVVKRSNTLRLMLDLVG